MKRETTPLFAALLATALMAPVAAQAQDPGATLSAGATAEADADADADADEAATDDILEVLDLPLVAVELSEESGIAQAEIVGALEVAEEAGLGAGEATQILEGEREGVRKRGKKKNFHFWLRKKVANGEKPGVIRQMIKDRDDEEKLSDEDKEKLKEAVAAYKKTREEHKEAVRARRAALKAEGKAIKLRGVERHREREAKLAKSVLEELKRLKAAGATHPQLDARIAAAQKKAKQAHRKEKRVEERRKDAVEEAREERGEAKEETEEAREARKEAHEARKEAREAMKESGVQPPKTGRPGHGPKDKLKDKARKEKAKDKAKDKKAAAPGQ